MSEHRITRSEFMAIKAWFKLMKRFHLEDMFQSVTSSPIIRADKRTRRAGDPVATREVTIRADYGKPYYEQATFKLICVETLDDSEKEVLYWGIDSVNLEVYLEMDAKVNHEYKARYEQPGDPDSIFFEPMEWHKQVA